MAIGYKVICASGDMIYLGTDLAEAKKEAMLDGSICVILANGTPLFEYSPYDGWRGL